MKTLRFDLNLKKAIIVSTVIHFLFVFPFNDLITSFYFFNNKDKPEFDEIEFEFYQAVPKDPKEIFIPKGLDDIPAMTENIHDNSFAKTSSNSIKLESHQEKSFFAFELESTQDIELIPSLEEETHIEDTNEKTSDSLKSQIELIKLKEEEKKIKWDYCNRIRTLIENHAKIPESLANQNILDVTKVEISINREGKLKSGSPRISKEESSRYPELNKAAIEAVKKAAKSFPPLPDRVKQNSITFSLPIKFSSELQKKTSLK